MRTPIATLTALMLFAATPVVAGDFQMWKPLAEAGDSFAQRVLAAMYAKGKGVPKNGFKAVYWYKKAAKQGDLEAQNNLGVMYDEGNGVPAIPAADPGIALDLLVDLYTVTEDARWLDGASVLAETLLPLYFGSVIPSGAAGIDWYESQMGPAFLVHGLTRLALMARYGADIAMPANYTQR